MSSSFNTVVSSDRKFIKNITYNGLSFKLDAFIVWFSKIGYLERITGVLSIDIVEDFEPFNE